MTEIAKGLIPDDDKQRAAEEQVGKAIEALREKMPTNFVLVFEHEGGVKVHGAFSLNSAQNMLKVAIDEIAHEYAYQTAVKV